MFDHENKPATTEPIDVVLGLMREVGGLLS